MRRHRVIQAERTSGALQQSTTWDPGASSPEPAEQLSATGSVTASLIYNPDAILAAETTPAGTFHASTDWLGSVTGLFTSADTQVSSTTYSPYGIPSATGSPASPAGFAGSCRMPGSGGLDNMNARDYNPATGLFTSVDPELATTLLDPVPLLQR